MRIMRSQRPAVFRTAALFVLTAALAGPALTLAPSAFAAEVSVTRITTADTGGIDVGLADQTALWVKATVRASTAADAPVLASTDDLTFDWQRGWHTDKPLHLADGTAYGDYPVDIDYRLPGGTVQHWSGAEHGASGLFGYRLHTGVAETAFDRTYTDFDHQSATLTGKAETFDPATGTTGPARAGTTVRVGWQARVGVGTKSGSATAVTDDTGAFQAQVTPGGALTSGSAAIVAQTPDTVPRPASALSELGVRGTTYRITAGPETARVHAGSNYTVSGQIQRLTQDGWKPFAGAPVVTATGTDVYNHTVPGLMGSGTADASGRFSFPAKAKSSTYTYTYAKPSEYLGSIIYAENQISVPKAGSYSSFSLSLDAYRTVTASGKLNGVCGRQALVLQYSKNGAAPWHNIRSATTGDQTNGQSCAFKFTGAGYTDGYYRVVHSESNEMLSLVSPAKRLNRVQTRITSFSTTPSRPYKNATLTATGTLTQLTGGKWKAQKGARVVLVYKPKGDSQWYWVVKATTNSAGRFTLKSKAYGDGTWGVYYEADSKHFYSESNSRYVDVR
ncbi:hypothetical protein [Streptomyces beijiangensis]|uniref:Carboxypeptidase regulatory-like domain-containing protein n=1 Tax=Streptomyces beijiangensis TaxID=163361 RepID=A0A939JDZ0_9ACTN|nr:hypothetical protein [Streptomyces beijiangensis]MBO0510783.1 hypothetical protein [Streptomyces beijiangensis]